MKGIRLQYLRLELRKWLIFLKRNLLLLGVAALVLSAVCAYGYRKIRAAGQTAVLQTALVIPGEQKDLTRLAKLLQNMDSIRGLLSFVYPEEEEVDALFETGRIQAAVYFGEDFYQDVTSGINTPVKIRVKAEGSEAELLRELLADIVTLVDITEAQSYAMIEVYGSQETDFSLIEMENKILRDNVELFLDIRDRIKMQILSPTGKMELKEYYAASILFIMILLPGLGFWSLYDTENRLVEEKLKIYGIGRLFRSGCKLVLMTLVILGYEVVFFGILRLLRQALALRMAVFDGEILGGLLFLAFGIAVFYHSVLSLSGEHRERRILVLLLFLLLLLLGGCIVPCACLPAWFRPLTKGTPFLLYRDCLAAVLFQQEFFWPGMLVWIVLFLAAGELYASRLGQRSSASVQDSFVEKRILNLLRQGGFQERILRMGLFLKWQLKRKSPVVILGSFLLLVLVCSGIRFPKPQEKRILICGEEPVCRELEQMEQEGCAFRFLYEADSRIRTEAVAEGKVLAAADFLEEEICVDTAFLSPKALAARESIAVAYYRYARQELLRQECAEIFGNTEIFDTVQDIFEEYRQSQNLFRVEYQVE